MGSNNQIGIQLVFSADTARAKNQLQDLEKTLTNITKMSSAGREDNKYTKELAKAKEAAASLKAVLKEAVNPETGNINIEKFNRALKNANLSAEKLKNSLIGAEGAGAKAFLNLARSVAAAEEPIKRTDNLVNKLWETMKNTMKWQISSSALHGLMSAFSGAIGYAEDLNKSLNNIRIVSGASKEEMAQFAIEANNAAKALDTTTVAYTDAALIYYQQGLKGEDVKKRADTTVQLSNISGDSVEEVSNQLTAIWNNFYDGSKSLEYYADVLTALGAATASSSDEIAGGLERFSSIADTVGLSYEYASSALATITSVTRQSEDVVGTALKTIFARIQGLKLGETLEDGTTLNKYSEALQNVGISIFDSNNELKNMDAILEEMGAKWQDLSKDQRVALAQSVAGVRQYNQLVSLMDNWNVFEDNLRVAQGATGALQEQAEIYSESWEAAAKNVRAAMQDVFDSLINDEFFIDILEGLEKSINLVGELIDSLGGLKGVLAVIGTLGVKVFNNKIAGGLNEAKSTVTQTYNRYKNYQAEKQENNEVGSPLDFLFNRHKYKDTDATRRDFLDQLKTGIDLKESKWIGFDVEAKSLEYQKEIAALHEAHQITEEQVEEANILVKVYREIGEVLRQSTEELEQQEEIIDREAKKAQTNLNRDIRRTTPDSSKIYEFEMFKYKNRAKKNLKEQVDEKTKKFDWFDNDFIKLTNKENFNKEIDNIIKKLQDDSWVDKSSQVDLAFKEEIDKTIKVLKNQNLNHEKKMEAIKNLIIQRGKYGKDTYYKIKEALIEEAESFDLNYDTGDLDEHIIGYQDKKVEAFLTSWSATESNAEIEESIKKLKNNITHFGNGAVVAAEGVLELTTSLSSLKAGFDTLKNDDLSWGDKAISIVTSLSMAIISLTSAINDLRVASQELKESKIFLDIIDGKRGGSLGKGLSKILGKGSKLSSLLTLLSTKLIKIVSTIGKIAKLSVPLIAIFTAIGIARSAFNTYREKEEEKINESYKRAKAESESLKEYSAQVSESYSEMIGKIDEYEQGIEGLKNLRKGTEEYDNALQEVNQNALALLETHKELSAEGNYSIGKDGLIQLDSQALEEIKTQEFNKKIFANSMATESSVELSKEKGQNDLDNLILEMARSDAFITQNDIRKIVNELKSDSSALQNKEMLSTYTNGNTKLTEVLWSNRDAISLAITSIDNASGLLEQTKTVSASQIVTENSNMDWETTTGSQILEGAVGEQYDNLVNEQSAVLEKDFSKKYKEVFEEYAKLNNLDWKSIKDSLEYDSETQSIIYKDIETGEEISKNQEEIIGFLARYKSQGELVEFSENLYNTVSMLYDSDIQSNHTLASFLSNKNLEQVNLSQLEEARESSGYNKETGTYNSNKVKNLLGLTGTSEENEQFAQQMGYDSAQEFINTFVEALALEDWHLDLTNLDKKTQAEFKNLGHNMSYELVQNINNGFSKLSNEGQEELLKGIEQIEKASTDLSSEEQTKLFNDIFNINWDSSGADIEDFNKVLSEYQIELDSSSESMQKFFEQATLLAIAEEDIGSLRKEFSDLTNTIEKLKIGDIISSEEYQQLIAYNRELAKFFTILSDGSAMLVGDPLDMQQLIKNTYIEKLKIKNEQLNNARKQEIKELENENKELKQQVQDKRTEKEKIENFSRNSKKEQIENINNTQPLTSLIPNESNVDSSSTLTDNQNNKKNNISINLNETNAELNKTSSSWQNYNSQIIDSKEKTNQLIDEMTTLSAKFAENSEQINKLKEAAKEISQEQFQVQFELAMNMDTDEAKEAYEQGKIAKSAYDASWLVKNEQAQWEDIDVEQVEEYAEYLKQTNEELKGQEEAAEETARANIRLNRGIKDLAENYEEWSQHIGESSQTGMEATEGMRHALADILDVSSDLISNEMLIEHMDEIGRAAQGDAAAIENLGKALSMEGFLEATNASSIGELSKEYKDLFDTLNTISLSDISAEVGINVHKDEFIEDLNAMISETGATTDEIVKMFAGTSIEPEFDVSSAQVEQPPTQIKTSFSYVDGFRKVPWYNPITGKEKTARAPVIKTVENIEYKDAGEIEQLYPTVGYKGKINGKVYGSKAKSRRDRYGMTGGKTSASKSNNATGGGGVPGAAMPANTSAAISDLVPKKNLGPDQKMLNDAMNNGGGGGGGKDKEPTPAEKMDKTERDKIVERYYEITKAIEVMTDALSDANKATDRLYGTKRIAAMKKEQELTKASINLLKQKKKEAQGYLQSDKNKLLNNEYGINFQFDKDGNVSNYTNILNGLFNELTSVEDTYNSFGTKEEQDKYKESTLDPLNKKIEKVKELVKQYDDTNKVLMDIDNEIQDKMYEIQDRNYEIITYKVELQIEVNDMEQKKLDYFIHKYEDDFYKMAESQALLGDSFPLLTNNLATYKGEVDELTKAYNNNEISQAKYIEGLKEINDKTLESLSSLIDLDREMLDYYNKTLEAAGEKFKKATDKVEHQLNVLEHYKKTMELLGKDKDYYLTNKILGGQYEGTIQQYQTQKKYLEMLQKQQKAIENNIANSTGKQQEGYRKELEALIPKIQEAESAVDGLSESILELSNAILENDLQKLGKDLEKGMLDSIGYKSLDSYLQQIDRLNKSQEEYLTTTNKVYETNKLIRKAQQDMADTESDIAKEKYKDYIKSVEKLGEQNKLSKYELEIAQARYEVLQAQLALEDAKQAKDAMRLVRDSSGNWNYVYTANQDKIDDAQQRLEDAQNSLYNIGLQGAQDYQDKQTGLLKEYADEVADLINQRKNGEIASVEEFNRQMQETTQFYYNQLKDTQQLYKIAHDLMVDESFAKEADYLQANMVNLEDFKSSTSNNLQEVNEAFDKWKNNTSNATESLGTNLENLDQKINESTSATEDLSSQINDELVPSLEKELESVQNITDIWLSHRDALYETLEGYEKLQSGIQTTVAKAAGVNPGGTLPNIPKEYQQDYSAVMASMISQGISMNSNEWKKVSQMREEKIKWLAGHGYSSKYWGTSGVETQNKFSEIVKGRGDQDWYQGALKVYSKDQIKNILKKLGISQFRTGGYTGDWGASGKLGVLHEKELILNKEDTSNLLQAIQISKQNLINKSLISNVLQDILNNFINSYKNLIISNFKNKDNLEQNVHIEANFPNVSVATEIENAFEGLVNKASQHIDNFTK